MQTVTTFAVGTSGITIPEVSQFDGHPVSNKHYAPVKVMLSVPTLNAGTHTISTSIDGGSNWIAVSGPIAITGYEVPNPTTSTSTGGFSAIYGPFVPGTKIRVTSSVAQTANISALFMA